MKSPGIARKMLIEGLGTFFLVFVGSGAIISMAFLGSANGYAQLLVIALAHGLALAIAVTAALSISGGNINPAVTIAMLVARKINVSNAIFYIMAQVIGAAVATALLISIVPLHIGASVGWGVPTLASSITVYQGIAIEAVITFLLVTSVFMTAVNPKAPKIGGLGIGLTLAIVILFAGPFTGGAANPAVALGPEIATLNFTNWYVYWIGPVIGGIISALICNYILLKSK